MDGPSDEYLTRFNVVPLLRPRSAPLVSLVGWILLLLVVAVIGYVVFGHRLPVRRPPGRPSLPPSAPASDDLGTLGLSEVRVAAKRAEATEPARPIERAPEPAPRPVRESPDRSGASAPRPVAVPSSATPRYAPPAYVRPGSALWPNGGKAVAHLLASLAEHVGGTAAVLRHEDGAYVTEALAGTGSPAPDPIDADACPLHRAPQDRVLTVLPNDLKGLAALGAPAPRYARALAEPPAARAFLVIGVPEVDEDPERLAQIERYADLLAAITHLSEETEDEAAGSPVPRADIIREEQAAARESGRPLAFALVTLAHAEELLEAGGPDLSQAEAALRTRLADAPDVLRVEPFGDLLVGAFLGLSPEEMAEWCTDLASSDPPLFIGAVAPAEGAPEAVRDAAAEALRDAYDQRRAQIVSA